MCLDSLKQISETHPHSHSDWLGIGILTLNQSNPREPSDIFQWDAAALFPEENEQGFMEHWKVLEAPGILTWKGTRKRRKQGLWALPVLFSLGATGSCIQASLS